MFHPKGPVIPRSVKTFGLASLFVLCLTVPSARAADQLGGHFGAVFAPLVTTGGGDTIFDDFAIGFPMGITVKPGGKWNFDLELVPSINPGTPLVTGLLVHPGVLRDLGNKWTFGLRFAIDVSGDAWGFTPLLNKGLTSGTPSWFVEGVVPIRFSKDAFGDSHSAIALGVHVGVGF